MAPPLPVSSLIVEDWFNGFYSALMLATVWIIISNKEHTLHRKLGLLAWVIAPYICSTLHSSLNWVYYSEAINDNELPTGPGLLYSLTHLKVWIEGTGDTFFCLNILMADFSFIWRCWVIWGRRWPVVLLPIMAMLTGAVLAGFIISDQVIALSTTEAFTIAKKSAEFVKLSTTYFCLSIATSLTTTLLITTRILLIQRAARTVNMNSKKYNPVIEILVESAVLYSVTLLIFVVLDVTKNSNVYYAQNIHAQMAGLAPLLISLRVAAGQSRSRQEWSGADKQNTTMQFAVNVKTQSSASDVDPEAGISKDGQFTISVQNVQNESSVSDIDRGTETMKDAL